MAECLACLGEGELDFRDDDAMLAEHFDPPPFPPLGIVVCDECGGSGQITQARHDDLMAWSRAAVDQLLARIRDRGLVA